MGTKTTTTTLESLSLSLSSDNDNSNTDLGMLSTNPTTTTQQHHQQEVLGQQHMTYYCHHQRRLCRHHLLSFFLSIVYCVLCIVLYWFVRSFVRMFVVRVVLMKRTSENPIFFRHLFAPELLVLFTC